MAGCSLCHFETALRRVRRSGAPSLSLHAAHPGPYPPSQCLSSIAEQYYDKLQAYMQAIWQLTVKAVTEDSDELALQALCVPPHCRRHGGAVMDYLLQVSPLG